MVTDANANYDLILPGRALSAYMLGTLDFASFFSLQRRLVYDIGGDRGTAAAIICDHPAGITIGREGSRANIRPSFDVLSERFRRYGHAEATPLSALRFPRSPVQWVSRGGGTMLHLPGQVACYPILPLDLVGLTPARYLEELQNIALELLKSFQIVAAIDNEHPGIRVNGRRAIHVGVAIRERITCFGLVINVNPNLELFHEVHCDGDPRPMTSLQRESAAHIRVTAVRQRLLELMASRFGFDRVSIFHNHPSALPRSKRHVAAPRT